MPNFLDQILGGLKGGNPISNIIGTMRPMDDTGPSGVAPRPTALQPSGNGIPPGVTPPGVIPTAPTTPTTPTGPTAAPAAPTAPPTNFDAANLAYARAKDMIANQTRAALNTLRDQAALGGQFQAGGNNAGLARAEGNVISRGEGSMANFLARQATEQANASNARDFEISKMKYGADIENWLKTNANSQEERMTMLRSLLPLATDPNNPNRSSIIAILRRYGFSGLY